MKTQKILILGITGNLARLKILPSIGQYYDSHCRQVNIEIYGYSRSKANLDEIELIIKSQIKNLNNLSNLPKIILSQGEYWDNTFFDKLESSLTLGDSLAIYLAVPPNIYTSFLENSCSYSKKSIHILIEKPFGQSIEEASNILNIVETCDLQDQVHFLDHYLFKSGLQTEIVRVRDQLKKYNLQIEDIEAVDILATETIDVKNRGGYYDNNGAIKDMFPHLYSFYNFGMSFFDQSISNNWSVLNVAKSQYSGYKADVNNPNSQTETSFVALLKNTIDTNHSFTLSLKSGKKYDQKITKLTITFKNKYSLELQLYPKNILKINNDQGNTIQNFDMNLDKKLDHTRVFENVFAGDFNHFVPNDRVLEYWQVYDKIVNTLNKID